ncbi:MAG TPA: complex I NDUFA9 subunit family protein [Verrucomicrobiae bacterium]|nr:complex I NDUFA9 subunit family protein [Verrucomicrobiae bacterium]
MKVFVTGATGFVGTQIVRQLRAGDHSIRLLVRRRSQAQGLQATGRVELHEGDVTQPDSLRGALAGVDAVIHLVGIISECGQSTFENVHVEGTRNILAAAVSSGVSRFVHMSALGTRPNARSRYHQTKWKAEEGVRRSGLRFTIFRPSLIFGPGDHFVNLFAKIARFSPFLPVIGNGQSRFAPVSVDTVAMAFARSLTTPEAIGGTFDLCGPQNVTFDELLDEILRALNRRRMKLHVPLWLARAQASVLEWVYPRLLGRAPPLNRDQILMLEEDNVGDCSPAEKLFELPRVPLQEGIRACLAQRQWV